MTGEEEIILWDYVVGGLNFITTYTEFDEWYVTIRDGSDAGEQAYHCILAEAKAYKLGRIDGEAWGKKLGRYSLDQ